MKLADLSDIFLIFKSCHLDSPFAKDLKFSKSFYKTVLFWFDNLSYQVKIYCLLYTHRYAQTFEKIKLRDLIFDLVEVNNTLHH